MNDTQLKTAIFLDRDGTINEEKNYLIDPADFEFIPGVPEALKQLQNAGFLLVVITNQSGIGRGYFTELDVENLHQHMKRLLAEYAVKLSGVYFCPHHPKAARTEYLKDCNCRKGNPGLLLQAAEELGIDLKRSFMIGDKDADLQAGLAAGCKPILVRTGYGEKYVRVARQYGAEIVKDLKSAAELILT